MGPLYKQLLTASPSTLLDIKKLQKRSANLFKNRAWFQKHYPSRWGPIFFTIQGPESGGAEKKIFRFLANGDQCLRLSTSMQHCLETKTQMELSKLRLEAVSKWTLHSSKGPPPPKLQKC
jgi:hypothetical protein